MKQRGSAILIAVFLVAAVGSAAFAIGRLFLMDAAISDKYESSVVAYYAAESGIEEGLLRYRYNKNQEVPIDTDMPIVNLTGNNIESGNPASYAFAPLNRYYVPSVTYLQEYYGEDVDRSNSLTAIDLNDSKYPKDYYIIRDESIKIDLSQAVASGQNIDLIIKFINDDGTDNNSCLPTSTNNPFVEITFTGRSPSSSSHQTKAVLVRNNCENSFPAGSYLSAEMIDGALTFNNIITRVRNLPLNIGEIFETDQPVSMMIKPVHAGVKFGIKTSAISNNMLPAPYNTIKSTGHYGGVTRTLQAQIDRQAGTVYDLFDFVLYRY